VNAEYLKGLISVIPARGPGERRYCVGWFAIEMYYNLLDG